MNPLSVFVATLSVLAAFATALIVPLPVVLPRELDHVYALLQDPARTYLTVSTNSSQTSVVHMHSDRTFYIDADADVDTAVVEFILALHSLDVDFPAPQFALSMHGARHPPGRSLHIRAAAARAGAARGAAGQTSCRGGGFVAAGRFAAWLGRGPVGESPCSPWRDLELALGECSGNGVGIFP